MLKFILKSFYCWAQFETFMKYILKFCNSFSDKLETYAQVSCFNHIVPRETIEKFPFVLGLMSAL